MYDLGSNFSPASRITSCDRLDRALGAPSSSPCRPRTPAGCAARCRRGTRRSPRPSTRDSCPCRPATTLYSLLAFVEALGEVVDAVVQRAGHRVPPLDLGLTACAAAATPAARRAQRDARRSAGTCMTSWIPPRYGSTIGQSASCGVTILLSNVDDGGRLRRRASRQAEALTGAVSRRAPGCGVAARQRGERTRSRAPRCAPCARRACRRPARRTA